MLSKNTNSKPKYIRKIIKRSFLNGQVKLTEIWKAVHQHDCPITVSKQSEIISNRTLRSMKGNNLVEKECQNKQYPHYIMPQAGFEKKPGSEQDCCFEDCKAIAQTTQAPRLDGKQEFI